MSYTIRLARPLIASYQSCIASKTAWSRVQNLPKRNENLSHDCRFILCRGMAGHSKWANIKHTKAAKDAERQKKFMKCSRLIKLAVKEGGSTDPKLNSKLARAIEYARSCSMPVASIESALKASQKTQDDAKPAIMEYRGPGGVFILTELLTSNISRTRQMLQTVLKKHNVQETRGALNMFEEKGIIIAEGNGLSLEAAMDNAIEIGAEDVEENEDGLVFTSTPDDFLAVKQGLENLKYDITYASVDFIPVSPVAISENDQEALGVIIQKMEDIDDVMKVHVNL
ncbi:probable transcriptional regulatory protein Kole_1935 isoform X2 [Penaeus japonicus]|uniref:probable transcriptional regulatory protein Kole_1935 isoform X1 n=1 Tax=Penaeus japonicus TaxID=27405 RepID=UPI001C7132C9|nr:probable transcriptional regulatory protein Kole_1935 isoform X1 [Penaeus japonicus]XP_042872161.1 probable transcriptional regulatory protein Kole_1935 isoform X2 [Penaeus japonicus]